MNLEWSTKSENQSHAYSEGLQNKKTKFSDIECNIIRSQYKPYINSLNKLAKEHKTSLSTIKSIIYQNKAYKK